MFEKTLTDIVKGIRASKRDTALYISQCIAEIKTEINSTDLYVKANALNKLTFLQSMGYGMSWASFASIEVMSSPRFAHKRIGYLAACQGFNQNTDVILLTTNLLQKELRGAVGGVGLYEAGLAINCISNIVTEDLARDVLPEVTNLTQHSQPYLRKKAILCLFKLFMKYPQGLRLTFDKIQLCLEDSDPSVVSCAVNVVTELSDKNPKNYLHLAPAFFQLLTKSQNNWMLIKVVKLLGSLVPCEPRLARKLLEPLAGIVETTQAKSLLYEAVYTITLCLPYCRKADGSMPANAPKILELCGVTLKEFCADKDQNLKYLGLVGFSSLRQSHPKCLMESDARPLILACLSDEDVTIRTRALDLLPGMTSRKNLQELVAQLLKHVEAASGQYKKDLVVTILELCSSDKYALLQDFSWYLDILLKLSYMSPEDLGEILEKQITDVALRVLPVRAYAVQECTKVLIQRTEVLILPQVLPAAAWIVGEYSDLLEGDYHNLVQALTLVSSVGRLQTATQSVYIQAALKVFAAATNGKANGEELVRCVETLTRNLPIYIQSVDVEVQERAFTGLELMRSLNIMPSVLDSPPGLTEADDEEEEGDLLGMVGGAKPVKPKKPKTVSSSLASRCRSAAPTLNYLFKPEPMKPISAKAQRKKRQAPVGGIDRDWLDAPVDMSVFSFLDDIRDLPKPSMEQVSFTQQRPFQPVAPATNIMGPTTMNLSGFGSDSPHKPPVPRVGQPGGGGESSGLNQTRNNQDPFYLDSGGKTVDDAAESSKFGSIQLLGSDDEADEATRRKRKKKEKKMKKQKAPVISMMMQPSPPVMTVYSSEDDDDDDDQLLSMNNPRKPHYSKDFAGLASVDLTTPLGDDEMMPSREHRQVPDRAAMPSEEKVSKKKKKRKEKKEKKATAPAGSNGGGVGDLLDLGGFSSVTDISNPSVPPPAETPTTIAPQTTSISSAFDDLLGLEAPAPVPAMASATSQFADMSISAAPAPSKKGGKKSWMKASLKIGSASGSPMVDWNQVYVFYKVTPQTQGLDGVSATINLRVQNDMPSASINNLTVTFKKQGQFTLGTIAANDSEEAKKIGPFSYDQFDAAMDLKGTLSTSENCSIPIKITLPASLHLTPTMGLTLESVMAELSSQQFASTTAKVELSKLDASKVKPLLASFFCAAEVDNSGPLVGTLAAQSHQGAKVRVLVKVKDSSVKIDIKSTNAALCKALAADVKKLVL
jgi:AP-3 complex subunit delta-1